MGSRLEEKSKQVRKRIENHIFEDEGGDEYEGSKFGGFPEYFRRKKIKLQNLDHELRAQAVDKPKIFKGIVCHINGYTQPSLGDLHTMIVQHGGGFIQYLDGKTMVTHIIASNLTPKKKEEFKRYRIVQPAWIVDSINEGKLLPWDRYRVVDEGVAQKVLGFDNGNMVTQANKKMQGQGYKEHTQTSWYSDQLKAQTPKKQVRFAQTTPPSEQVNDDDYQMPDITSSMERAMESVEDMSSEPPVNEMPSAPRNLLEVRTELGTPPSSSPPLAPGEDEDGYEYGGRHDSGDMELKDQPETLQDREGSQEPDYSMAIVENSERLKNISPEKLANMTAEEHNALLLSDPRIRKSTVVNPDFLEQYYRESRLHHLSTWKADLKAQMQAMAAEKSSSQKVKLKKLPGQRRYIMHVDFDSFFAAVSLKKYPQYVDKPAVVAHGSGSGSEIASCNYPARKFGIHNGMWMKRAQQMCPEVKILPYDFPGYEDASRKFYDAIIATGGTVQSVSIDEALVDISATCFAESASDGVKRNEGAVDREQHKADQVAQQVRDEVFEKTGCAVSVGIGGNILLAKTALRKAKPAGQYQLKPEDVLDFIGDLEVQKLPGVAWSIGGKLEEIGIKFVKDIREVTRERLVNTLGPKTGEKIWDYSRGIDRTEVGDQVVRKSVSAEVNWGVRFETQEQVDEFMHGLCGEVHKRLVKERVKGKQLTMKVMRRAADAPRDPPKHLGHGKCDTYNKSIQLGVATNDTTVIAKEAIATLKSFGISPGELRGIGVQVQKLEPLKPDGAAESSQRRLFFKSGQASKPASNTDAESIATDDITDDIKTPQKQITTDAQQPSIPVEVVNSSTPSKRKVNTLGTQFVLPTQVDPSVLAELPADIRAKLSKHFQLPEQTPTLDKPIESETDSRPSSRAESPLITLPNQSQLDTSILEALPEDLRREVLGFYSAPRTKGGQALLPQSPRKVRTIPPSKLSKKQPIRKKRGGGLFSGRMRSGIDETTLTQANFAVRPPSRHLQEDSGTGDHTTDSEAESEKELDPDFLNALPEELRAEVLAEQRNLQLQRKGGIDLTLHSKLISRKRKVLNPPERETEGESEDETVDDYDEEEGEKGEDSEDGPPKRSLLLPPRPPVPTFTARKLSALPDLRDAVKTWYLEFYDEKPYEEDVQALIKYLRDVVLEERDMSKAVAVAKWMRWVIEESEIESNIPGVKDAWVDARRTIQGEVQKAIAERGLGPVDFE